MDITQANHVYAVGHFYDLILFLQKATTSMQNTRIVIRLPGLLNSYKVKGADP